MRSFCIAAHDIPTFGFVIVILMCRVTLTRTLSQYSTHKHCVIYMKITWWVTVVNWWQSFPHQLSTRFFVTLKTCQPSYLRSLLSFPSRRSTRSSSLITLGLPSLTSRPKITNSLIFLLFCSCLVEQSPIWSTSSCHSFIYVKLHLL